MNKLSQAEEDAISKLLDRTEELIRLGKSDDAKRFLDEIEKYKPDEINVPFQRGVLFAKDGEHEKALEQFRIVYKRFPRHFENLNNMATSFYKSNKYIDATEFYKKALAERPGTDFVLAAMGACYYRQGLLDESIDCIRQAIKASPDKISIHSGIFLPMIFAESVPPEKLTEEARIFGEKFSQLIPARTKFANEEDKNRKIRIGYVSPDLRDHPVPYFLEPLLKHHDKDKFEVFIYSSTPVQNPVMDRIKSQVDFWRDIFGMSREEASAIILEDTIDILVDVAGHTAHNNMDIFIERAAPIQATWLGYPATTGIKTMDYRITDNLIEPAGMTEHLSTEKLWRLPHIFCAYMPHEDSHAITGHPPFEEKGFITFGCFNNYLKVRDSVLDVWAEILNRVPESKLLWEIDGLEDSKFLNIVQKRLKQKNISLDRVILEPRKRSNQFVLYNQVDIALDPFPCNGGTTSFDTLWMGVPFVTLAGKHFASRMGVTILTNAGLTELIAQTPAEYIEISAALAIDKEKLKNIRSNLRDKFASSRAMDHKAFTAEMENAYRGMWEEYCNAG